MNANTGPIRDLLILGGTSSLGQQIISYAEQNSLSYCATYRTRNLENKDSSNYFELDIANAQSISDFLKSISDFRFTNIIYCIAETSNIRIENIELETISEYFQTHITNTSILITGLLEFLDNTSISTFLYISSRAMIFPSYDFCYASSKAAVASLVSSLSRQLPNGKRTLVLVPGALIGSSMFKEMPDSIQRSHIERSNGLLLSVNEAAEITMATLNSNFISGSVIEIGPSYK